MSAVVHEGFRAILFALRRDVPLLPSAAGAQPRPRAPGDSAATTRCQQEYHPERQKIKSAAAASPQLAPPPARPQPSPPPPPPPPPQVQQRREPPGSAERPVTAVERVERNEAAAGASSSGSGQDKYIRFWLRQLASDLADMLRSVAPDTRISPSLAAAVLNVMPAPAPARTDAAQPAAAAAADPAGSREQAASAGPDLFTQELAALLRQRNEPAGGPAAAEAAVRPSGSTAEPPSQDERPVHVISPGTLMLLLKLVTDLVRRPCSIPFHSIPHVPPRASTDLHPPCWPHEPRGGPAARFSRRPLQTI